MSDNYNKNFSLNNPSDTFAFKVDIKPAAQHSLSSSIVEPTGSAVDKVKALEAYYFYMNELGQDFGWDRPSEFGGVQPKRIGLIAQELMAVEPSLVRKMTWLDVEEDYYWVDYEALYVLCLDAINELNARAEAAKVTLGITPADTYPVRAASTTDAPRASNFQLTVTPTSGPEGSSSVWTLTADDIADGTEVGFKLTGTADIYDVTCATEGAQWNVMTVEERTTILETEEGYVKRPYWNEERDGWCTGIFTFTNGQAQITLNYVADELAEEDETIIMTLKTVGSNAVIVPELTATAVINS